MFVSFDLPLSDLSQQRFGVISASVLSYRPSAALLAGLQSVASSILPIIYVRHLAQSNHAKNNINIGCAQFCDVPPPRVWISCECYINRRQSANRDAVTTAKMVYRLGHVKCIIQTNKSMLLGRKGRF